MYELVGELLEDLGVELGIIDSTTLQPLDGKAQDAIILESKIRSAVRDVRLCRNYQTHHKEEFIWADMETLYIVIRNLALYDWNLIGAEGEESHSENGISRSYTKRSELLSGIVPFVKVL